MSSPAESWPIARGGTFRRRLWGDFERTCGLRSRSRFARVAKWRPSSYVGRWAITKGEGMNLRNLSIWGVIVIALVSFGLSLLATLYPSYRASRINPAAALRYE